MAVTVHASQLKVLGANLKFPEMAKGLRRLGKAGLYCWHKPVLGLSMDLQFAGYELKLRERQLIGPGGSVDLSSRSFDILVALLARPNEMIGKSDLFDAAWPGVVVEENTLQVHVSSLRKLLGPGYIATVHGRGYKYVGPMPQSVTAQTVAAAAMPSGKGECSELPAGMRCPRR